MLALTKVGVFMTTNVGDALFKGLKAGSPRAMLAVAAAAAILAGCGGGTQAEKFAPSQIISLGDENSFMSPAYLDPANPTAQTAIQGARYGVNYLTIAKGVNVTLPTGASTTWGVSTDYPGDAAKVGSPSLVAVNSGTTLNSVSQAFNIPVPYVVPPATDPLTLDGANPEFLYVHNCSENKLWTQVVASSFGKGYAADCTLEGRSGATSVAELDALVSAVQTQFTANRAQFNSSTLATVFAGTQDVVQAFKANVAVSDAARDAAVAAMELKGQELGRTINEITTTGARVAYLNLPALQYSPLARAQSAAGIEFMRRLVVAFNHGLTGINGVINDGHKVALVDTYADTKVVAEQPGSYGFTNAEAAWCQEGRLLDGSVVAADALDHYLLSCNSRTGPRVTTSGVMSVVSPYLYVWAGAYHYGPAIHARISSLAYSRINDNPL
jgi:phospholipase/lecithinase/hemolysin